MRHFDVASIFECDSHHTTESQLYQKSLLVMSCHLRREELEMASHKSRSKNLIILQNQKQNDSDLSTIGSVKSSDTPKYRAIYINSNDSLGGLWRGHVSIAIKYVYSSTCSHSFLVGI